MVFSVVKWLVSGNMLFKVASLWSSVPLCNISGDVLVTVLVQISVPFIIAQFSLSGFVSSSVNIIQFCLPINHAPNECV